MLIGGNRAKCDVIKKLMLLNTSIPWELRKHFKSSRYRLKGQTPRAVMWRKWDSCGEKFPQQSGTSKNARAPHGFSLQELECVETDDSGNGTKIVISPCMC